MKRNSLLITLVIFSLFTGCSFFHSSKVASGSSPAKTTKNLITKKDAIQRAKAFAKTQGLNDEFNLAKASKIDRRVPIGEDPTPLWEVYFPSNNHSMVKFYKNTFLMIEIDSQSGEVKNWSRR